MSYTTTTTRTNTRTWAAYLASKVAADLKRCQRYYGKPTDHQIDAYIEELTEYLVAGYLESIEYGFKKAGKRVVTLRYTVDSAGNLADDRSGGVYAHADITGATWFSYLTQHPSLWGLSPAQRAAFESKLPIDRTPSDGPSDGDGYWVSDRSYSQDGSGVRRQTFRPI